MARASSQHSAEYSSSMAATAHTCTHTAGAGGVSVGWEGGREGGGGIKSLKKKKENQPLAEGEEKSANPAIRPAERNIAHQF